MPIAIKIILLFSYNSQTIDIFPYFLYCLSFFLLQIIILTTGLIKHIAVIYQPSCFFKDFLGIITCIIFQKQLVILHQHENIKYSALFVQVILFTCSRIVNILILLFLPMNNYCLPFFKNFSEVFFVFLVRFLYISCLFIGI